MKAKKANLKSKQAEATKQLDFTKEKTIAYTIGRLPERIHRLIRIRAAEEGKTNLQIILTALEAYMSKETKQ